MRAATRATPEEELTNDLRRHTNSRRQHGVTDAEIAAIVARMEAEDAARKENDYDA
jgi:hypothetical protein